jgi:hypothetical protein
LDNLNSLKSQPEFRYHGSLINEMQACQLFYSSAITYLLVTPGMHRHLPNLATLPFSANGIETMSGPGPISLQSGPGDAQAVYFLSLSPGSLLPDFV